MPGKWVYDGTTWQPANAPASTPAPKIEDFLTSTTWTKDPLGKRFVVEMRGGGGSGASANTGQYVAAGAAGGYTRSEFTAEQMPDTATVTIGAGGASVTSNAINGNPGGTTSFVGTGVNVAAGAGAGGYWTASAGDPAGTYVRFANTFMNNSVGDYKVFGSMTYVRGNVVNMNVNGTMPTTLPLFPGQCDFGTRGGGGAPNNNSGPSGDGIAGAVRVTTYYE
jgi:hypothetical protein